MVTPKHLDFSSSDCSSGSDDSFSRQKSPLNPSSKRAASDAPEEETRKKKKKNNNKMMMKKKKKKTAKLGSPLFIRIWDEEDELTVLKGLVDFRAKSGFQSKIDWDAFYRFLGGSIVAKFSKDQVLSKIRKLKRRFLVHLEKINLGNDPKFTRSSDSEAFGFSMMLWGQNEAEYGHDDDGMDKQLLKEHEEPINENKAAKITDTGTARIAQQSEIGEEMLKEHEEPLNQNGAAKITDNSTARIAQQSESGEMLKEHEEVADEAEPVNENGSAKTTANGTTAGEESHDDDDELCAVRDAFETVMSQGLSDYQKMLQLEKLMNIGTGKRRELSNEWKALCVEERRLNIKKLRFSAKLAEAANDS